MATHIDINQKLNVYPRSQNQDQKKLITLSHLDRQCPLLMYLVFFYKKTTTRDFDSVFSDLKLGLEETLSVWYPAAGRLGLDGGGCKLNLRCNRSGAVMVEAVATGVKLSDLGDLTQYNEFYETLVYKPSFDGDFSAMPLVVGQVTKFACGGYSVGIGTSHSLFDGISAYEFLHAWAFNSHNHDKSNGKIINKKDNMVIKPVHDRGNLLVNGDTNRSLGVTMAAAIYHLYQLIKQAMMIHQGKNHNFELADSSFVIKTFDLSGDAIETMMKKSPEGFMCSSFEFLAAHLWKARTRALRLRRDAMVCLQFAVDIRKRTVPPLPEGYSGNAYASSVTVLVMILLVQVSSTQYKVGDLDSWGIPTDAKVYTKWPKSHSFKIGDSLLFLYPPSEDSMIQVTASNFKSCNTKDPILYMNDGNSLFNLTQNGTFYFTSGHPGHCQKYQKLIVSVGTYSAEADALSPSSSSADADAPSYQNAFGSIPLSQKSSSSSLLFSTVVASLACAVVVVGALM